MKLTMTFEDKPDGIVEVVCTPTADEILERVKKWGYSTLSPAEAMMAQSAMLLRLSEMARTRKALSKPD